jgi:hypothetical protein
MSCAQWCSDRRLVYRRCVWCPRHATLEACVSHRAFAYVCTRMTPRMLDRPRRRAVLALRALDGECEAGVPRRGFRVTSADQRGDGTRGPPGAESSRPPHRGERSRELLLRTVSLISEPVVITVPKSDRAVPSDSLPLPSTPRRDGNAQDTGRARSHGVGPRQQQVRRKRLRSWCSSLVP